MVGAKFDSQEEFEFSEWCREAQELGMLTAFEYHPPAFKLSDRVALRVFEQLKTKVRETEKFLLHPHEYTTDFRLAVSLEWWTDNSKLLCMRQTPMVMAPDGWTYVDVKGGFSPFHDQKSFSINQKWVYAVHGVYINKIIPEKLFRATWVPEAARRSPKKNKLREKYAKLKTKGDICESIKKEMSVQE